MGRQPNTVINPNTGRPIRVDGPTFQKLSERDKSYALKAERSNPSTTINPHTNRAILRDGPTAQKLRQESSCYSPRSNKTTSMKECYEPFSAGDMGISGTREKASKKTSSSHHHHHHHHDSSSSHRSRHTSDIFDSSLPIILSDREEPVPRAAATRAQVVNNTRIAEPQAMESQADSFPMSSVTRASSTEAATSPPPHEHQQQYQNNIGIEDNNNYIRHYDATGRREDDTTSIVEESSPATDDSVPVEQADNNSVVQVTETSDDEVSSESRKPSTVSPPNGDHIQQVETTNDKWNRFQKVSPSQQQISLQPEEEEQVATSALQHQLSKQSFYVEIIEEEEKSPRQQSKGLVIEQISSPVTEPKPTHRSPSKELNTVRKNLFANVSPVVEQTEENRPPTTSRHTLSPGFSSDDEDDDCCSLM